MARADASPAELAEAGRWLERACRLAPADLTARFQRASLCLRLRDAPTAAALLAELAANHDVREVWAGLAAARRMLGDRAGALEAARACLSRHALFPAMAALAADLAGERGWCGLHGAGTLTIAAGTTPQVALDGVRVPWRGTSGVRALPASWRAAYQLTVRAGGAPLLGSPIEVAAIRRVEGFVTAGDGGVTGWAWHPADPERLVELSLLAGPDQPPMRVRAEDDDVVLPGVLLGRARGFSVAVAGPVRVVDPDGRDLLGSPLDPGAEQRAAAGLARLQAGSADPAADWEFAPLPVLPRPPRPRTRVRPAEAVVVLVIDHAAEQGAALEQLLATTAAEIIVVEATDGLPAAVPTDRVTVIHAPAASWTDAAKIGLDRAGRRDVALLDATIRLAPGWLERLQAACRAQPDIGTASPLIATDPLSLDNVPPIDIQLAQERCVYLRRACLDQTGSLHAAPFAQGEGAIANLCLRATALGWRHVAVPGVVAQRLAGAETPARAALAEHNRALLTRLHPGLDSMLAEHPSIAALALARRRLDSARWRHGRKAGSVILITHADGGGVERHVRARCDAWSAAGQRVIVLRPARRDVGRDWCVVGDGPDGGFDALRFRLPDERAELAALLRDDRVTLVELHHRLGHHHSVLALAATLAVPYDVFVHDYVWFCPRVLLVGRDGRYCGEPELAGCEACIADLGHNLEEDIGVAALRQRSAAELAGARRVVAPSQDAAARLRRHFPSIRAEVSAWEPDPPPAPPAPRRRGRTLVCVVGALGVEKGFDVLLACARDAAARALPLDFVVVGHTMDDARLMDTGRVFVTGEYREEEAVALIGAQQAALGFIPSIWPETWCYTLSLVWAAGLPAVAFDLGTPAERIRRVGRGDLLPLGLPPPGVNQALLACAARVGNDRIQPQARARASHARSSPVQGPAARDRASRVRPFDDFGDWPVLHRQPGGPARRR